MYKRFSQLYIELEQYDKAEEILLKGLTICKSTDYSEYANQNNDFTNYGESNLYCDLFRIYLLMGEYDKCIEVTKQIPKHSNNEAIKKQVLHNAATAYMLKEDFDNAYINYIKARDAKEYIYDEDDISMGMPDSDVFVCCFMMGRYEEAYSLAKSLGTDYGVFREEYIMEAIKSRFMEDGTIDMELVQLYEEHLLHKLEDEEVQDEQESIYRCLSIINMAKGNEKMSDYYREQSYKYSRDEGVTYGTAEMESWRWAFKKEYKKALEEMEKYEYCADTTEGTVYGDYRFFKKMCANIY